MKRIVLIMMFLGIAFTYAQNEENIKYERKGDLVEATIYGDNGNIEQHGFFKDKKLHGTWTYYNSKGEKTSVGNYVNGVKSGKWIFYNKDVVKEVQYLNGKVINVTKSANKEVVYN